MDDRDDWLEGVRRWYFGGDAPADAQAGGDDITWPTANPQGSLQASPFASPLTSDSPCNKPTPCADCAQRRATRLATPLISRPDARSAYAMSAAASSR